MKDVLEKLIRRLFFLFGMPGVFFGLTKVQAENWSNWMGPRYDGSTGGFELNVPGKNQEFKLRWEIPAGAGWSSPLIFDGSVYFHDRVGEKEFVHRLDALTGKEKWNRSFISGYRDDFGMSNGPRSTPAIAGGTIVTHGPDGMVRAISIEDGTLIWTRDLKKDFSSPKGFFGRCSSPLIVGGQVILDVGGSKVGLVSFSLLSGETNWTSKPYGNDYASPVPFVSNGDAHVLSFMREGFLALEMENGSQRFFDTFRSPIDASVNAASPLVVGNRVFLSSCYEVGAGLWEYQKSPASEGTFIPIWQKKEVLDCHYSTPVAHDGYLFGFHGRQERGPVLRCVRLADGLVKWEKTSLGSGNLVRMGDSILTLNDRGELVVFSADSASFKPLHRQQILGTGGRSHFAISNGLLVARDKRRLVCLELSVVP